ncbi:MAG: hypothetical protein ABSA80_15550, partial [Terriglobales bacterium]
MKKVKGPELRFAMGRATRQVYWAEWSRHGYLISQIASLTMSAVSSTFEAHQSVQSEERHFALVEAFAVAVAFALPT